MKTPVNGKVERLILIIDPEQVQGMYERKEFTSIQALMEHQNNVMTRQFCETHHWTYYRLEDGTTEVGSGVTGNAGDEVYKLFCECGGSQWFKSDPDRQRGFKTICQKCQEKEWEMDNGDVNVDVDVYYDRLALQEERAGDVPDEWEQDD